MSDTLISPDRLAILIALVKQCRPLMGDFWECGVFRGGSARIISDLLTHQRLYLFDTFIGLPAPTPSLDDHREGDFSDTSLEGVKKTVPYPNTTFIKGLIPDTFKGFELSRISFAHVDVDLYASVKDCVEFIYPRILSGGIILFDDYGFPQCRGAKVAVDEYCASQGITLFPLATKQAFIWKC